MSDLQDVKEVDTIIEDLRVHEISLVSEPANERDFLQLKSKTMPETTEIEKKDEFKEFIKDFDEDKQVKVKSAVRSLNDADADSILPKVKSMFSEEEEEKEEKQKGQDNLLKLLEDLEQKNKEDDRKLLSEMIKDGESVTKIKELLVNELDKGEKIDLSQIKEEIDMSEEKDEDQVDKSKEKETDEVVTKQLEELKKEKKELEKQVQKEREIRIRKQYIDKAKNEYDKLPKSSEEIGLMLKEAEKQMSDDNLEVLKELLKSHNEMTEKSELTKELGDDKGDTGMSELEKKKQELKEKDSDLTDEQALDKAIKQNPELLNL